MSAFVEAQVQRTVKRLQGIQERDSVRRRQLIEEYVRLGLYVAYEAGAGHLEHMEYARND